MKFILANVPPGQSDSHIAAPNWIQVWLSAALSCMLYAVQCNLSCDVQAKLATALWEPPKWTNGVKVVLTDVAPGQRDSQKAALTLTGDAGAIADQLTKALPSSSGFSTDNYQAWRKQLTEKVQHLKVDGCGGIDMFMQRCMLCA